MQQLKEFLWFCSGAHFGILKRCPTDSNKYIGIGGTILFTSILASISAAYALFTVFGSGINAVFFGLLWGLMIFNLDRYIVSSMKKQGSFWKDFRVAIPRLLMAALIAIVITKPLELKIFEKEIHAELLTMEQDVFKQQEDKIRNRFEGDIQKLKESNILLEEEIALKETQRNELMRIAREEADGTGGSGKPNLGPIYRSKKVDADRVNLELQEVLVANTTLINGNKSKINELEAGVQSEIAGLERLPYNGLAARLAAMHRLTESHRAIWLANVFILLLFIAIETAPIFVKMIAFRSPYDYVLSKHEYAFETRRDERISELAGNLNRSIKKQAELGLYKMNHEIKAEKVILDKQIGDRIEVARSRSQSKKEQELLRIWDWKM